MADINRIMAAAIQADMDRLNIVGQNISNVQTTGFKRLGSAFPAIIDSESPVIQSVGSGVLQGQYSFKQGAVRTMESNTSFAILGNGFFQVRNHQNGTELLTRNGEFLVDDEGYLALQNGYRLEGENGPVRISDKNFKLSERGEIFQNGAVTDRIPVFLADDSQYVGDGLYDHKSGALRVDADAKLLQFALEASNVVTTDEMLTLLALVRHFGTTSKMLGTYDRMMGASIDTLGAF